MVGQIRNIHVNGVQVEKSQQPSVSKVQCLDVSMEDTPVDFTTFGLNVPGVSLDPDQAKLLEELTGTAINTKQKDKLLLFPPHGDEPVK